MSDYTNYLSFVLENKLRKKWKYLRDQFSVELGKLPPPSSGDASGAVTPKWMYFSQLLFLKDTVKPRISTRDLTMDQDSIVNEDGLDEIQSYLQLDMQHANNFVESDETNEINTNIESKHEDHSVLSSLHSIQCSPTCPAKRRRGQIDIFNEAILDIEKKKLEYLQSNSKTDNSKEDDHLFFFKSLLPHVRKIPESQILPFRNRVQELVDQFAYQNVRKN